MTPLSSTNDSATADIVAAPWDAFSPGEINVHSPQSWETAFDFGLDDDQLMEELLVPNLVGDLGEVQPISGMVQSWQWVIEQLKGYPRAFARHAETPFIHRTLYTDTTPRPIRAALGVCAALECLGESNESMFFRVLDAEVLDLLQPPPSSMTRTLLEDLAKVQALVLYQIMRLFYGNLSRRILAEQQADVLKAWSLQLLRRADDELRQSPPTWETWIQAESIRRTVLLAFTLYGINSIFKHGVCLELPTLGSLPVSTQAASWKSKASYLEHRDPTETMKYTDFGSLWLVSPPRRLDPFEKVLLVCCKGIEQVEARSIPD